MSKETSRTITSCCTVSGTVLNLSFDALELTEEMKKVLEKRLLKKGIALQWMEQSESPELLIRVVEINEGNQFLRWLLPFISPAALEVEGEISMGGAACQPFHYVQKAQMGLFGGSARGMLKVCATRVADKIARDVLKALPA